MCGIFGYTGNKLASDLLLQGLERLEYRGYDSAGLATVSGNGELQHLKSAGKLSNLINLIGTESLKGNCGIGHTRWATHGEPNDLNAHPHGNSSADLFTVHNGIVENYFDLKQMLVKEGHNFLSETDSEVIPHLISHYIEKGFGLEKAIQQTASAIEGSNTVAVIHAKYPGEIIAFRVGNAGGLTIGLGVDEMFISSDLPALAEHTNTVYFLQPGHVALVSSSAVKFTDLDGNKVNLKTHTIDKNSSFVAKGGFEHFMLKEIMDQPESSMSTLRGRLRFSPYSVLVPEVPLTNKQAQEIKRVVLLGMGSSLHAAQMGALYLEKFARIPAVAEDSSEFRYRNPVIDKSTLVIAVGQSGETADTLEAMNHAKKYNSKILSVANVEGSQSTRIADGTVMMHSGYEVGVASTKTFTGSLICLLLVALHLANARSSLTKDELSELTEQLTHLPRLIGDSTQLNAGTFSNLAKHYSKMRRFLFIGRGLMVPIASEGAMKLKEISYLQAEGMTAASMKHGPIALVDAETPVIALATNNEYRMKNIGNINEVLARGGSLTAVIPLGDDQLESLVTNALFVPKSSEILEPIIATIPLQLLAYHIADYLNLDVDQPRNLAKSVTVE